MKIAKLFLAVLLFTLTFISCDSNDSNGSSQNDDTFAENFGGDVSKDFIGQVVDLDNHPIQNAEIKIGNSTVQTDSNGVFIINGAAVHEKFAYITAKKAGYLDGSRAMVPTSGKNNVKIMMIPNTPLETVQSGAASEVSLPTGTKVNFDGAFQDENGNSYSGAVNVSLYHLAPGNENIDKLMPGMLYAQTQNNQEAVLETLGMLNVELRGSDGQKLNIATGHTAEITVHIDDSQLATAPGSIPLWHFDDQKGYWKEDGMATKVGNNYVGEVSHFSWWNCDLPFAVVALSTRVVDSNGNPLGNMRVYLAAGDSFPRVSVTDENGRVAGLIPANVALTLTIRDECGVLYTASIGPFANATVLPDIVISNTESAFITTVNGSLLKCDNSNVTNGYILLTRNGNNSYIPVTNGSFSFNWIYCSGDTNFTLKGVDADSLQETGSISYNFATPITNVGNLQACTAASEFLSYQIDNNQPVVFTSFDTGWNQGHLVINSNGNVSERSIFIYGSTNVPGIYSTSTFTLNIINVGYITSGTQNTLQFNLSQYGAVGSYVDLTFSGTYTVNTVTHTLTGTVHALRDY
jgi:hypothetical protein